MTEPQKLRTIALIVSNLYYPPNEERDPSGSARGQLDNINDALLPRGWVLKLVYLQDQPIIDGAMDFTGFDAIGLFMAWGYPQVPELWAACLAGAKKSGLKLVNPLATIEANKDKAYLLELQEMGVPIPSTIMLDDCTDEAILAAFDGLKAERIVVKPAMGSGAWRQFKLEKGEALPAEDLRPPKAALAQPFIESVPVLGEISVLCFGGTISHSVNKVPQSGDYRTQGFFGAAELPIPQLPKVVEATEHVLAAWKKLTGDTLVYARIDLVAADNAPSIAQVQQWLVMELEVIEPFFYFAQHQTSQAQAAQNFVSALVATLAS